MIDYNKIASAVTYYQHLGYEYIEAPWLVSLDSMLVTRPKGARLFSTFAGELVASGEQSFIEVRDKLKPGKYQCVTPCFRDEPVDELHKTYFIKNELIWIPQPGKDVPYSHLIDKILEDAIGFFGHYGMPIVKEMPLDNAINNSDIMINDIEVGSYGLRHMDGFIWIYGTGCAEPRLSQATQAVKPG